jgi:hypothetical protein
VRQGRGCGQVAGLQIPIQNSSKEVLGREVDGPSVFHKSQALSFAWASDELKHTHALLSRKGVVWKWIHAVQETSDHKKPNRMRTPTTTTRSKQQANYCGGETSAGFCLRGERTLAVPRKCISNKPAASSLGSHARVVFSPLQHTYATSKCVFF